MQQACVRVSIPAVGPHRLRHALATEMVSHGVDSDRHQPGAAAPRPGHHGDLREDRPGVAAGAGPALAGSAPMTDLRAALTDYLALRNRLGHELADAARVLPRFVTWMEHEGQSTVTITAAIQWSQQPNARPGSVVGAHRMTAIRGFARYLSGHRSRHASTAAAADPRSATVATTVHLHTRRPHGSARRRRSAAVAAASGDLPDPVCAARGHRDAGRGSDPTGHYGRGLG